MSYENPWTFDDQIFDETFIGNYYGFVYLITNIISGKKYIGRKYFYSKIKKQQKDSNWRVYYGSSKNLLADITNLGKNNFKRQILSLHETRGDVNYWETKEQFNSNVLEAKNENGDRLFYNDNIISRYFVPKEHFTLEHRRNLSLSHYGKPTWNKGLVGVTRGINLGPKTTNHKAKISQTLKTKGIKPKTCGETPSKETIQKLSKKLKILGTFVTKNPRKAENWIANIQTETEIISIENPSFWAQNQAINYNALRVWSEKHKNDNKLHPKYKIKIISLQTKDHIV